MGIIYLNQPNVLCFPFNQLLMEADCARFFPPNVPSLCLLPVNLVPCLRRVRAFLCLPAECKLVDFP